MKDFGDKLLKHWSYDGKDYFYRASLAIRRGLLHDRDICL